MPDPAPSHPIFSELAPRFASIAREHEATDGPPRFRLDQTTEDWIDGLAPGSPLIKLYGQLLEEDEAVRDRMREIDIDSPEYDQLAGAERSYAQHHLELFGRFREIFGETITRSGRYAFSVDSTVASLTKQEARRFDVTVDELECAGFIEEIAAAYREQERYDRFLIFEERDRRVLKDFFADGDYEVPLAGACRQIELREQTGPVSMYLYENDVYIPGRDQPNTLQTGEFESLAEEAPEDEFDLLRSWVTLVYCDALDEKIDLRYELPTALARAEGRVIDRLEMLLGRPEQDIEAVDFIRGLTTKFMEEEDDAYEQWPETD